MKKLLFTIDDMQGLTSSWGIYRDKRLVSAIRITAPFTVLTHVGKIHCKDGYLAKDLSGYPYPISKDRFEKVFELVKE